MGLLMDLVHANPLGLLAGVCAAVVLLCVYEIVTLMDDLDA